MLRAAYVSMIIALFLLKVNQLDFETCISYSISYDTPEDGSILSHLEDYFISTVGISSKCFLVSQSFPLRPMPF